MKSIILILSLIFSFAIGIFAQDFRKNAESNPLDTAYFLLTIKSNEISPKNLSRVYFDLGEYEKSLKSFEFEEDDYSVVLNLSYYSSKAIERNKTPIAHRFLDKALQILRADEDSEWESHSVREIARNLVLLGREKDALEVLENQEEKTEKVLTLIGMAEASLKILNQTNAIEYFTKAKNLLEIEPAYYLEIKKVGVNLAKLNQTEKASEFAVKIEKALPKFDDDKYLLNAIISIYLKLDNLDKAEVFVTKLKNKIENRQSSSFFGFFLDELSRVSDDEIVQTYIKLGDIESAKNHTHKISENDDNYNQQKSYMFLADYFIEQSDETEALQILDIAFQKARKIEYVHLTEHSVGASPGSRKEIYLRNIYQRQMKLGEYEKALQTIYAIKSEHKLAKEFLAEYLVDFANRQIGISQKKEIDKILKDAQNLISKNDDFFLTEFNLLLAEHYAKRNNKQQAIGFIVKALKAEVESCCLNEDFLLKAGLIFAKYELKSSKSLRTVLRKIIEEETS